MSGSTRQKAKQENEKILCLLGSAPPRQAVIKAIEVQVEIRTELRTGSGTRLLSVRYDTATRHVKIWPDGRRELMPRSYTLSRRAY